MLTAKRREFMALLGGAVAAWPLAARAQRAERGKHWRPCARCSRLERFWQVFPEALRDLGYIEGKNIRFEIPI